MMDATFWLEIIDRFGFPALALFLMFWLMNNTMKKQTKALEKLTVSIDAVIAGGKS